MIQLLKYKKISFTLIFLLGAISSLSLPPYNFFYINFITLSFLFIFLIKNKTLLRRNYFLYGWLFGLGYFLCSLYWISISLTFDSELKILIPISLVFSILVADALVSLVAILFAISQTYKKNYNI